MPSATFATGPATTAPSEYVVVNGDFLAGIAAKVGVTLPSLLSANNLTSKSLILPGDKLVVPAGATAPTPPAAPTGPAAGGLVHTVKSGDSLYAISRLYKVTLADLLAINNFTVDSAINPNMQLALPATAVAPQSETAAVASDPAASDLTYTILAGDSLAGIASKSKVKLTELLAVNKLKASSLILPGAKLALPPGAIASASVQTVAGAAGTVVAYAYAQLGKPYRFFTAGPNTFDCSGLVRAAYAQIGIDLVHQSASQALYGTPVDIWSQPIKPGDLVFLSPDGGQISHVGIAVDATHWIHSPRSGDVVRLGPLPAKGIVTTVRRIVP
ncbi:MAG: LysM peptidoglycan-binding domain-containing protein [Ilumatobacteraceae bacterium]